MKFTKPIFLTLTVSTVLTTVTNVYPQEHASVMESEFNENRIYADLLSKAEVIKGSSVVLPRASTVQSEFNEDTIYADLLSKAEVIEGTAPVISRTTVAQPDKNSPFTIENITQQLFREAEENAKKDQAVTTLPAIETKPIETTIILSENVTTLENALTGRPAHIQYILDNAVIGLQAYRDNVAPQYITRTSSQNLPISAVESSTDSLRKAERLLKKEKADAASKARRKALNAKHEARVLKGTGFEDYSEEDEINDSTISKSPTYKPSTSASSPIKRFFRSIWLTITSR